ncbi:MAG: MmcQ/YjbR family DNA-binding protein [Gammaproteobacteria bacterium]
MARDIHQVVREVCLWLPEAEEFLSHGSPNFRVRGGKTFAMYAVNHHGDGRVALWLNALPGAQELHVGADPQHFFVPPYVGPRGWLGVRLDKGLAWKHVTRLVREAYEKVASPALRARIGKTPVLKAPDKILSASQIDPMKSPAALRVLKSLRKICLELPESREASQFGCPVWQAGTKTFALARHDGEQLSLNFWVGVDTQGLLTADARYTIPPYMGHNGWISLDVSSGCDWQEIKSLTLQSYRHFALQRMLLQLPPL